MIQPMRNKEKLMRTFVVLPGYKREKVRIVVSVYSKETSHLLLCLPHINLLDSCTNDMTNTKYRRLKFINAHINKMGFTSQRLVMMRKLKKQQG